MRSRRAARASARIAYDALRSRLRTGLVTPEDRMVDLEIAAQLGMSRMPVREALLQLVAEGVLVSTARGYRIPTLDPKDVMEVFELRKLLEPRAAALAARDLSRAGIAQLSAALSEAKAAQASEDFPRLFRANVDFRETWLGAVRNKRLAAVILRCSDQVLTVRMSTLRGAGDPSGRGRRAAGTACELCAPRLGRGPRQHVQVRAGRGERLRGLEGDERTVSAVSHPLHPEEKRTMTDLQLQRALQDPRRRQLLLGAMAAGAGSLLPWQLAGAQTRRQVHALDRLSGGRADLGPERAVHPQHPEPLSVGLRFAAALLAAS